MNRPKTIESASVWREDSYRLLGLGSRTTRASRKKMGKHALLLVVGYDVVFRSSGDVLVYGRVVCSADHRHRARPISLIDSVRSERLFRVAGIRQGADRGDDRAGTILIDHLIDLDREIGRLLSSIRPVIELE